MLCVELWLAEEKPMIACYPRLMQAMGPFPPLISFFWCSFGALASPCTVLGDLLTLEGVKLARCELGKGLRDNDFANTGTNT